MCTTSQVRFKTPLDTLLYQIFIPIFEIEFVKNQNLIVAIEESTS